MRIVFDERFCAPGYAEDNAAMAGRMEAAMSGIAGAWEAVAPSPATWEQLRLGHGGELVREASLRICRGRRFAVLEGGYYLPYLGANVLAFCRGFAG